MDCSLGVCSYARVRPVDEHWAHSLWAKPPGGKGYLSDKVPQIPGCNFQFTTCPRLPSSLPAMSLILRNSPALPKERTILCIVMPCHPWLENLAGIHGFPPMGFG